MVQQVTVYRITLSKENTRLPCLFILLVMGVACYLVLQAQWAPVNADATAKPSRQSVLEIAAGHWPFSDQF